VYLLAERRLADTFRVSIIGAHIQPSVSGITPAERAAQRAKRAQGGREGRDSDEVTIRKTEAVRGLAGNDQEEAHEDRQAHEQYTPGGFVKRPAAVRNLDIQG
jgi:hypothetical protein